MALANYFNRRAIAGYIGRRYAGLMFRGRQYVESGEANEMQDIAFERVGAVGDATFGPISLREGGTVVVGVNARTVRLGSAKVWAGGYMHDVPAATLTNVPMVGVVPIGIAVASTVIDRAQDDDLKGMVPNTKSHGETLAARLRYDAVWALAGDPFYPIHTIIDGQLPNERTPPSTDIAELLVERHLRETHGSHIAEGFNVSAGGFNPVTQEQTFVISSGVLRAEGRRVARSVDQRFRRLENPDLVQVNGEVHAYPAGGLVTLLHGPIESVQVVTVVKRATRVITHQLAGGIDALPDTPVFAIESVVQGGTTYAQGTSWTRSGDGVSWAPAGPEPAPGTTYAVTYLYTATVAPQAIGRQTLQLEAAVVDQPVTVLYRYKLPRVDVLAINLEGEVVYLEGLSSRFNPVAPPCPAPLAPLVRISNLWGIDPVIEDVDQRKLTEAEVRAMLRTLRTLSDQVSLVALERDIQERDPSSRRGSFVDPFENDRQRDLGIAQDAAIVRGFLMLPVEGFPQTVSLGTGGQAITLPFVSEPIISQPFRTLSRKINQYLNFSPLPTPVTLNPAVDRWNEDQSSSSSSSSASFSQEWLYMPETVGTPLYGTSTFNTTTSSDTSSSSSTTDLPFLRSIPVEFTVRRMGPSEDLDRVTFDGIDVTATVTGAKKANAQGVMVGTFTIPPNIRAGTKTVAVRGKGGSNGETAFTGQGTLTITHYHTTTHTHTTQVTIDPVAQSFVLEAMRQVTGARVEFTARGNANNHVVLEMRDMEAGLPGQQTLAEGSTPGTFVLGDPKVVKPENWTEIAFRFPTTVPANAWRWIALLTDDAGHSVAVAQLGDQSDPDAPRGFDARRQEWIRANPALGDFADGSNGVSWRLLPDSDLTHEIMAARYTALTRTVPIGRFKLSDIHAGGISDVIVLLIAETPTPATRVRIEMVRASGEVIAFEPNAALMLPEYLTEEVDLRMVLTGTTTLSPIVAPECQIIWGRLKGSATYVSEANTIDRSTGNVRLTTVIEANTPGVATVALDIGAPGAWDAQSAAVSRALGDGWIEREHVEASYPGAEVRTRITLTGTPKDRPAVRKLRQRATEI